jgi:hypothetical protein
MAFDFGHYGWAIIVVIVLLLAFVLYRRGKRLIGHQRFNERRTRVRTVIFGALILFVLASYIHLPDPVLQYGSAIVGLVLGVVVALLALHYTQMGRDEKGVWYVPNLYLGIGLIALLVARFVYEYMVVFPQIRHQVQMAVEQKGTVPMSITSQPILHAVLFLVLGYYLLYYAGIILRSRHMESESTTHSEGG